MVLYGLFCSIHKAGKHHGQRRAAAFQYETQEDRISWRKTYAGMTAYHAWKRAQALEKREGHFRNRQQQTCKDGSPKNIYFWKNPIPSCSQAVKTFVCIHSQNLPDSRKSFWNVPVLQFQEGFRHRQVKAARNLLVPCGRIHQGTVLCTAGR